MSSTTPTLTAELEAALLRRLGQEWDGLNLQIFRGAMRRPVLRLGASTRRVGQWDSAHRTLELSREFILREPWGLVLEVLKHEMAHQYVDERLAVDEPPHGPAFQALCARLGIDGAAVGLRPPAGDLPSAQTAAVERQDRLVARVQKLLALAESSNLHEAENAASAAQKLMLRYNIERASRVSQRDFGFIHLGTPSGRTYEHQRRVSVILTEHYFVEAIWVPVYRPLEGKRGSVLEICGTGPNLRMAEHVHDFLHASAERLWAAHKRARGIRGNKDRRAYLAGVMEGFEKKLDRQKARLQQEGLVWVPGGKLRSYLRTRHPHVRSISSAGNRRNEAFTEGHLAGGRLVLSKPVEPGTSRRAPRALKPSS